MSEVKPAARNPSTKKTGAAATLKAAASKEFDKKDEPSSKSIKEKSTGDKKVTKEGTIEKSSKSLLVDGASEKSSPRLAKSKAASIPVELATIANKVSKQLFQLATEFEGYLNQELAAIYTDADLKLTLEKSHNYFRVQECLLSAGLLGVSSAFTAVHSCLSHYKSLMRNKSKRDPKELSTTPANHKSIVEGLEADIKSYYAQNLKQEEAAKRKGIEVLTTGDFDQQKFERALSASSLRKQKPTTDAEPGSQITRQVWPHIGPVSFSTVEHAGSVQKMRHRVHLHQELEDYKERFELNFQKALNFKPLDAIYAVRQEFNDPLNTLTICGFSINSKGKIMDYDLGSGSVSQEHSSDCKLTKLITGAFDLLVGKDTLIYADWKTHKVVVQKNGTLVSTCEVKFKDYHYKKGTFPV